jgi:hypothetical protein
VQDVMGLSRSVFRLLMLVAYVAVTYKCECQPSERGPKGPRR